MQQLKETWEQKLNFGTKTSQDRNLSFLKLVYRIEELQLSEKVNKINSTLNLLKQLETYSYTHFREEEKEMQNDEGFNAEEHKLEHAFFSETLTEYRIKNNTSNPIVLEKLASFVKKWLLNHILIEDKKQLNETEI